MNDSLTQHAQEHLYKLCLEINNRLPGSPGNRKATDYFACIVEKYGFHVEQQPFECIDWRSGEIRLTIAGRRFDAYIGPYSLGCDLSAPLVVVSTVDQLQAVDATGKVLLLHGEIAASQLMPKNFVFYNPNEHKHIYQLLESKASAAVLSATGRDAALAGGIYPFPLIEDGDFNIPNAYMTEETGKELLKHVGEVITLKMVASRQPSTGVNVIAHKGEYSPRLLVVAHIDAKINTPGALDNATGAVFLLMLAELLEGYTGKFGVEIVALNGEDYYNAPGQMAYMDAHNWNFEHVMLAINSDGAGYLDGPSEYALYQCPPDLERDVKAVFDNYPTITPGEPWYQSDHSMFIQAGRPAMSFTSSQWPMISSQITHTPKDHPDLVEPARIVELAEAVRELISKLN